MHQPRRPLSLLVWTSRGERRATAYASPPRLDLSPLSVHQRERLYQEYRRLLHEKDVRMSVKPDAVALDRLIDLMEDTTISLPPRLDLLDLEGLDVTATEAALRERGYDRCRECGYLTKDLAEQEDAEDADRGALCVDCKDL